MTVMTRREMDDLLGRPTGPMLPPDEADAGGRPDAFPFPRGTYNDIREFPPGGALVNRPIASLQRPNSLSGSCPESSRFV